MHWLCLLLMWFAAPRSKLADQPGLGRILVASRAFPDPRFSQTVVLLVHYEPDAIVGLILNRPLPTSVAALLPDVKGAQRRTDAAYDGGPVEADTVWGLLRNSVPPDYAEPVLGDVALISRSGLAGALAGSDTANLRVFRGYSGWTLTKLQTEIQDGWWFILAGNSAIAFDAQTNTLWPRFIRQAEGRTATLPVR